MGRYKKGEWSGSYQRIMILAESGMKHRDIATKVGLSESRISRIIHDDRFTERREDYKEKAEAEIYEKFAAVTGDAADKIISIMSKGNSKLRIQLDAAKDILNYAGHKPKEQIEHVTNNYTIEDANSAKKVIEEIQGLTSRLTSTPSRFLLGDKDDSDKTKEAKPEDTVEGTIAPSPSRPTT